MRWLGQSTVPLPAPNIARDGPVPSTTVFYLSGAKIATGMYHTDQVLNSGMNFYWPLERRK
jgi:hypothetical protein